MQFTQVAVLVSAVEVVNTVTVSGVRGTGTVHCPPEHERVGTEHIVKPVPSYGELFPEIFTAECVEFPTARFEKTFLLADVQAVQYNAGRDEGSRSRKG